MIWAEVQEVAFGVKDEWVVAWYCPAGNTPAVGENGSEDAFKKNVKKTCIEDGMNTCYNTMALKAHNEKRLLHPDHPPLELYDEAAQAIQAEMDKPGFAGSMPAESARADEFLDCAESIYEETSTDPTVLAAVSTTNVATETWYTEGAAVIDYNTGGPKTSPTDQDKVDAFLRMIWKTTTKVAFGVKDKWVVAWYCDVKPVTAKKSTKAVGFESSPLLGSRRLLSSTEHRLLATPTNSGHNAQDRDFNTYMVTQAGVGVHWTAELEKAERVSKVVLTNAPAASS
jgi:hypothetical protein